MPSEPCSQTGLTMTRASARSPDPSADHSGVGRPARSSFSLVPIFDSVSSQAVDADFRVYLQLLAFISLSLALLNLLPLLPLDGGHIAFSIIEIELLSNGVTVSRRASVAETWASCLIGVSTP